VIVSLNHLALAMVPLAVWILVSGLDDLFIALIFCLPRRKRSELPSEVALDRNPERRIAVFVPLWREHRVIGQMLERNLSVIRYQNYDVFVGVYPNDEPTIAAVAEACQRHPRIHPIQVPHHGPTSKGDCLNWTFRGIQKYEEEHGVRFEIIVTHDAEDLIHPDSLRLINWFSADYDMVQVPVLPLPTPAWEITHGLYCDEFAEFQNKDIPVRCRLGGFLPSNGVGTGYSRSALERLAAWRGRIFDPQCLTEDYDSGYRLHSLGCSQVFVPVHFDAAGPVATREYFPRRFRAAIRQRSRWVAGIALQGWALHGWRGGWRQAYWFWRDRKGVVGNLLAPVTNLLFLCGGAYWVSALHAGGPWHLDAYLPHWLARFCAATLWLSALQASLRTACSASIYGWRFAAGVPVRMLWGNVVNSAATIGALRQFWVARRNRRTLAWLKTEHDYPCQFTVPRTRPRVGEILVRMRFVSTAEVDDALQTLPKGTRLGEHLVFSHKITEENLYQALSSQAGIPLGLPDLENEVDWRATRVLPAEMARRWKIIPSRVRAGELHLLTPEVPSAEVLRELSSLSRLEPRFRLIRPQQFEALAEKYLPRRR
jgi:adsorption protein B